MDKTINSYNQAAKQYEQQWASYLSHTHRRFLNELKTSADDVILDASCGTGLLAGHLVEQNSPFQKLILNDISANMQEKAKERLGRRSDVHFTQQSVQELNFGDQGINKILCLSAFHNYESQKQALQRFYDILPPGGQFYLLDWNNNGWFRPINWVIKKWVPEAINTKSLQETEVLLKQAGFKISRKTEWYFRYWKLFFLQAEKV